MNIKIKKTDNVDLVRALFKIIMPSDEYDDNDAHWVAWDTDTWTPVGFATAKYYKDSNVVYMTSAGVLPLANGYGIQRKLIRARIAWAKRIGASLIHTYTLPKNYPSMINLLKCGFKFYIPEKEHHFGGKDSHYYIIRFEEGDG